MQKSGGGSLLLVSCQHCEEVGALVGPADYDGVMRIQWACRRCGAGQIFQVTPSRNRKVVSPHVAAGGFSLPDTENPLT